MAVRCRADSCGVSESGLCQETGLSWAVESGNTNNRDPGASHIMINEAMFLFLFKSKYRVKLKGPRTGGLETIVICALLVLNLSSLTLGEGSELSQNCDKGCYNGDCVRDLGREKSETEEKEERWRCECWDGWRGEKCELCGGKVKLREGGDQVSKIVYFSSPTFLLNNLFSDLAGGGCG